MAATSPAIEQEDDSDSYIQTAAQNYVSRQATIEGANQVELKGRSIVQANSVIRGDMASIRIGRYSQIGPSATIAPPATTSGSTAIPVTIGSHTWIGPHCTIQAAAVGSLCWIQDHVTLGARSIVKDGCVVASGTIVPADTVIPPFRHVSSSNHNNGTGSSGPQQLIVKEFPPAVAVELQEKATEHFQLFVAEQRRRMAVKR